MIEHKRIVCWYSCGAASATAIKLAIELNKKRDNPLPLIICRIRIHDEHEDNDRFMRECEQWYGQEIIVLENEKYGASVDNVIARERYMSGVGGARCTKELKKRVRWEFEKPGDVHVFGMHIGEEHRIGRLLDGENHLQLWNVLIEEKLTKSDCKVLLQKQVIELPVMYKLGYNNNNCKGCLKAAGAGYWNKIKVDFPDVFNKRASQEKLLNVALVKMSFKKLLNLYPDAVNAMATEEIETGRKILKIDKKGSIRVPLRHLPVGAGNHKEEKIEECGIFCEMADGVMRDDA